MKMVVLESPNPNVNVKDGVNAPPSSVAIVAQGISSQAGEHEFRSQLRPALVARLRDRV